MSKPENRKQHGILAEIQKDLAAARVAFKKLLDTDIKAFNVAMGGKATIM